MRNHILKNRRTPDCIPVEKIERMNTKIDISNTTLKTPRLTLRPFKESDLDDFFYYASVDGVGQMAGWSPHKNKEESQAILNHFIEEKKTFALERDGKVIGSLGIELYSEKNFPEFSDKKCREIGYVLSKEYWGQGLMAEAVSEAIRFLFEEIGLDVIFCGHFISNRQSARVQEKCGFRHYSYGVYETRFGTFEDDETNILTKEEWLSNTKEYPDGPSFIKDNAYLLKKEKYLTSLFFIDGEILKQSGKRNYAIKTSVRGRTLLCIRVEQFNPLLYGDKECIADMLKYIKDNSLDFHGAMCSTELGDCLIKSASDSIGVHLHQAIGMDFMSVNEITEESSKEVTAPSQDDLDELYELYCNFITDCGLPDKPDKALLKSRLQNFRILHRDGKIVSMASIAKDTEDSIKITHVYTRPEFRGQGHARKVVNYIKNEIISQGKTATLNVDQKNPISNRLYYSLGFRKVFSQGLYLEEK